MSHDIVILNYKYILNYYYHFKKEVTGGWSLLIGEEVGPHQMRGC
jgi:hypothetical protein